MVATPHIRRKLTCKRREKRFLQRAIQSAVQPQTTQVSTSSTTANILAQWDAEGIGELWASRQDIGDSHEYAQTLREQAMMGYSPEEWGPLQKLLQAGLLTEIKPKRMNRVVERPSIVIKGKPLSEIIIEERR